MSPFKTLLIILTVIALGYGAVSYTAKRDKAVQQSAASYEACVAEEYGTTPTQWYEEQGSYPVCNK